MTQSIDKTEQLQRNHYNSIAAYYQQHYDDPYSTKFRDTFLYPRAFDQIPLKGKTVLEAMCGAGAMTEYLQKLECNCFGLDISAPLVEQYRLRNPGAQGIVGSIFQTPFETGQFDLIAITGGLHHLHPTLDVALKEIDRILKPGGHFVFLEPPSGTLTDLMRKIWYRLDPLFESNEEAIALRNVLKTLGPRYRILKQHFGGGPAYFLIYNSAVTRISHKVKAKVYRSLFWMDRVIEAALPRFLASYTIVQLRKD